MPLILVAIGQILKKWQQFLEIRDGSRRHLEITRPVEPPSREMNSQFAFSIKNLTFIGVS